MSTDKQPKGVNFNDTTNAESRDFSLVAKTWDDNPMRVELALAISKAILSRVPISNEMELLDYGAGTGLVTLGLQPSVCSVVAADSAQGMLDRLSEKAANAGLNNVETVLLDLESDPALNRQFDLIISSMAFHHIQDISALTGKLCSMLRMGGYLAVADLDLDDGEFHMDPTGVKHNGLDRGEMKRIFSKNVLQKVTVETAHTLTREVPGKGLRHFSVFLIKGKKG